MEQMDGAKASDTRPAALYLRVSTEKQEDEGISLAAQLDQCMARARALGMHVPPENIFKDAVSAKDNDRPDLQRLLALMGKGALQAVIFYDLTRLSRSTKHGPEIFEVAIRGRCDLHTPAGIVDVVSPEGEFMNNLGFALGQLERRKTGKRVKDTLYSRVRNGGWAGGQVPYGYRRVCDSDGNARLVVDQEKAAVIRRMFDLAAEGHGTTAITRTLHDEGHPSPYAGKTHAGRDGAETAYQGIWRPQAVKKILINPCHRGIQQFGEARGVWPWDRIVPEATALAAYNAVEKRSFTTGPNTLKHPWSRLCVCAICDRAMKWQQHCRGYQYMRCVHQGEHWLPRTGKPKILMCNIKQLDGAIAHVLSCAAKCQAAPYKPRDASRDVETERAAIKRKRENAMWEFRDLGTMERDEYERIVKECRAREDALLDDGPKERPPLDDIKTLRESWGGLTLGEQHRWLELLTTGCVVAYDSITIGFKDWGWRGWPMQIQIDRSSGKVRSVTKWTTVDGSR